MLLIDGFNVLELHNSLLKLFLFGIDITNNCEYCGVTHMVSSQNLYIHFEGLLKETQGILVVSCFHIALSEKSKDLGMELLSLLVLLKQRTIKFKGSG